jgi:subtilisin family serine protease
MSGLARFTRLRNYAAVSLIAILSACGGGGSGSDTPANTAADSAQAQSSGADSLFRERDHVAEKAAQHAFQVKTGALPGALTSKDYHPTRVLAKLIDTPQATEASARSSKFQAMGLRQMTGFATSRSSTQAKQNSQKSASNGMAIFEITDPNLTVPQAVEQLQRSGLVVYAEPDYIMRARLAPNDPSYGIYWHLKNTGQSGGTVGNDINAETAWNTTTGNSQMVVAVVDSGVKFDHPDLLPNMWVSAGTQRVVVPGDISGAAGVTDDANGANMASRRGNDTSIAPYNYDDSDHGTMVSGFVGAAGNNAVGGSGVSWNVKIMGLKIEDPPEFDSSGNNINAGGASTSSIVNSIRYVIAKKAVGVNVRIINISYGSYFPSQAFKDALDEANAQGILVVTAAGNDGSNDERSVGFPAGYKTPNLITVGALTRNNTRASFSNYGPLVHLFAPGANVPTTSSRVATTTPGYIAAYYRYTDGTSFASPIVAGAAAILWMQYPSETVQQIKARLLNSTSPFLTTADSMTAGKLNLGAAIASQVPCVAALPVITELTNQLVQGATHKISAFVRTCPTTTTVEVMVDSTVTQIKDDGVYPDEYANDGYYSGTFVAPASGATTAGLRVTVQDSSAGPRSSDIFIKPLKRAISYVQSTTAYSWDTPTLTPSYTGAIGSSDDGALPITSAFPVNFDGRQVSSFYMSTNGYVCMDDANCISSLVYPLPSGKEGKPLGTTQAMLAPWWSDWVLCTNTGGMTSQTYGTSPNRRLVLTWRNMAHYYNNIDCSTVSTNGASFQIVFYEGQNHIDFRYQDVAVTVLSGTNPSSGATGSAGIQLSGGKLGTQLFYKSATGVAGSTAFRFTPQSPSFTDVFAADFFATSVEGLRGARITVGCTATEFCADFGRGKADTEIKTSQQQMATFIARAINGHDLLADYSAYSNIVFTDVFHPTYTKYVNYVYSKGIMTGTGTTAGKFCNPDCNNDFVTRAQMARYLVKAVRGGSYVPPAATGLFSDVPTSHPEAPYIEEVARMKITTGTAPGVYSPSDIVSRGQMATFLQRTFRPFDPH